MEKTFGVTVQTLDGGQYQTWITTNKDGSDLIEAIREQFDSNP